MPSNNNWLDPLIVAACLLVAFVLNQVLPSLSAIRRGRWAPKNWPDRLDPVIVVACLFACQGAYGRPVSLPLVYLALLAFIVSSPLFGSFELPYLSSAGQTPLSKLPAACSRILVRWGAIVAGLLFLTYAFNLGEEFSRKVLLTWFVVTPVALCLSRVARTRSIQ